HDELLLRGSIQSLRLHQQGLIESIVENTPASAQHGFRLAFRSWIDSPRKSDAWSDLGGIVDLILGFQSQGVDKRNIRSDFPLVLRVESQIRISVHGCGLAARKRELRRAQTSRRAHFCCSHPICNSLLNNLVHLESRQAGAIGDTGGGTLLRRGGAENESAVETRVFREEIFRRTQAPAELDEVLAENH